ncbi:MAG: hypothetical protein ACO3BD_05800, partial [Chitinophagaceae bacterium]
MQASNHLQVEDLLAGLRDFGRYLLSRYRLFLVAILTASLIGLGWGVLQPARYAGVTTFILEEKGSGGGLEGLASQFGLDIGNIFGGGSGILSGDNILDIMRSKQIVYSVLLTKVDFAKGKDTITLADHYLDVMGWRKKYPELQDLYFYKSASQPTSLRFYINVKTGTSQANVSRLQARADSLSRILNQRTYQAAGMQILDANAAFRSYSVPAELSGREKMLVFELYAEVIKNLEMARIVLLNQTPVLQVLDRPAYPLKKDNWAWWKWMLAGAGL